MKKAYSLRILFAGFILIALNACNSSTSTPGAVFKKNSKVPDLNGTWGLCNYFDSAVINKKLAAYAFLNPAWNALVLRISEDTLWTYGSINIKHKYIIDRRKDTLARIVNVETGHRYLLFRKDTMLELMQVIGSGNEKPATVKYPYRRLGQLRFPPRNAGRHVFSFIVTNYFNANLIEGEYLDTGTNTPVFFQANGEVLGLKDYDTYLIKNYFGTSHNFHKLDVITFENTQTGRIKEYNWVFTDGKLILTEFIPETAMEGNKSVQTDKRVLGDETIELVRQKKFY
jgi:hypothetical protein